MTNNCKSVLNHIMVHLQTTDITVCLSMINKWTNNNFFKLNKTEKWLALKQMRNLFNNRWKFTPWIKFEVTSLGVIFDSDQS